MARGTDATVTDPVLAAARDLTSTIRSAEAARFELAATWAAQHPAPAAGPVVDADGFLQLHGDQPVTLAGEGAPGMSGFAIGEFAAAIGISTRAGRDLIGAALECKHRLPKTWARVLAGEVPVWKARRVTERTHRLTMSGAAYVDTHLAPALDRCSFAQIERAVEAAVAECDDEHFEMIRLDRWSQQHLDIELTGVRPNNGLVPVHGLLDYPDALALEAQVATGAHELLREFPELDLDTRRAMATGRLLTGQGTGTSRELVIYAHHTPAEAHDIVTIEGVGPTNREQIAEWCRYAGTRISIRPVVDLDDELATDSYRPTAVQREQAILTTPTCVFAHCTRDARRCDLDHIEPFDQGGATSSWNLAPLCRLHHRMKTHGHWAYRRLTRTRFEWTSPSGDIYDVDHTFTRRRIR